MKIVKQGELSQADKADLVIIQLQRDVNLVLCSAPSGNPIDQLEAAFAKARLALAGILDGEEK